MLDKEAVFVAEKLKGKEIVAGEVEGMDVVAVVRLLLGLSSTTSTSMSSICWDRTIYIE